VKPVRGKEAMLELDTLPLEGDLLEVLKKKKHPLSAIY
jgi:hypothetical protein